MTDKSMFDILSKFNSVGKTPVNESAPQVRRSSSAGDPAMFDILAKFSSVQEAGVDTSTPAGDKNKAFDKLDDTHFDQSTGDADVMATPSYGGYQATKNMKTGDVTQNYDNGSMRVSQSQNAQGDITRQSASYRMNDLSANMAQAGDEKFVDVDQAATGAGVGGYASSYDAGDGNLQNTVVGQVGSMDQTATTVSSDPSGNTNAYMSDRDTSNMIKQQEKDIARLSTDKLFNDVNEDENDMPASDEEASMAGDQAEYIKYAIDEIKASIEAGNSFPEWFQNKLSGVYTTLKDLHAYMEGDKRNDADDVEVVMSLEDVVSKDKAKGADVVGKKTAADDVVKELAKSYADFIAQVEEEKDDMSFFKKGK
jgi:hypothetical protein